tara:strand:- start:71 stop:385 length:315 start_codon:yes stop_codon:yes gene_type:complete
VWSAEDKKEARDVYSIIIHEADCPYEKTQDKGLPTNAYLVEYYTDNESKKLHYDITIASKKVNIFDFYHDKLKKGLKDIRYSGGTRNPITWNNSPTPAKSRRKK